MLALPLLLALAVTADPPAAPAEPAAAAAAEEVEGPLILVAGPELPGVRPPPPPAAPFVLTGFQSPSLLVAGAAARVGGSERGLEAGLELTLRHRGFVGGASLGAAVNGDDRLDTLGLTAGYGCARGRYRGEALLGWGVVSEHVDQGAVTTTYVGHYRSLQLAVDRAVWGGEGWRASLGVALWWRNTFGLLASQHPDSAVGGGLRLGVETGW
jgi:hypothetical protein